MIFQLHPNHGRHIAYHSLEAHSNEEHGWKTVSEDEFYGKKPKEITEPEKDLGLSRADLEELYISKFGKKPHHKKSDAKIMDELNGG